MSILQTVPKPGECPADWSRLWDADSTGLIELVLEANGIPKRDFLDGATLRTGALELFLLRIPAGVPVLSLFPNLKTLKLMNIGLRSINYLEPLRFNLEVLWLNENDISGTLAAGMVNQLHKLRELYLHFNQIEKIAPDALRGLDKLELLWLNENALSGALAGVVHLPALRVLNVGNNKITSLEQQNNNNSSNSNSSTSTSSSLPPSLREFNVAGNQLQRFQDLQPLLQLPNLQKLLLNDPTYGAPNPVCRLSNINTFLIFHAPQLANLDGTPISQQQRGAARSTYAQKYAFYSMRARSLRANMRVLQQEVMSVAQARLAQLLAGTESLQRLLFQLREADSCSGGGGGGGGGGSSSSASSSPVATPVKSSSGGGGGSNSNNAFCDGLLPPPSNPSLSAPIEQLFTRLRDTLSTCGKITALATQVGETAMRAVIDEVVGRSLAELHSGGNVRFEDQCAVPTSNAIAAAIPSAQIPICPSGNNNNSNAGAGNESLTWFLSCVDLFRSRMFLPDFSTKGVLDLVVTRVTKVHNKALRTRFDAALEELVDVSDPSFKRGIEYLFLVLPDNNGDSSNSKTQNHQQQVGGLAAGVGPSAATITTASSLSRMLELGPGAQDEPVVLTNSIYLHEAGKLQKSGFAPQNFKGRALLCKAFLGRSFPEAPELSSGMSDSDLVAKLPKIDGKKVLPSDTHAVMRFKKGVADVASSSSASSASASQQQARQRVWFVYRHELVLPEYVVDFDYKVPTSSSSPVGDIAQFPWLVRPPSASSAASSSSVSAAGVEQLKEEYLGALRSQNLIDPTRRGDLDAVQNRVTAAVFSGALSVSSSTTSSSGSAAAASSSSGGGGGGAPSKESSAATTTALQSIAQQNASDLLLMTPSLLWFATKSAELVAAGLKACADTHAAVAEKVAAIRKTNPALFACIDSSNAESSGGSSKLESLVTARRPSSSIVHLFTDEKLGSSSSKNKDTPALQLVRCLAVTDWSSTLQTLILPFANLGPELPAQQLADFELTALVELDLSFNELRSFHHELLKQSSNNGNDGENSSNSKPQQTAYSTPFRAPNLLRLSLAENSLSSSRDLAAVSASHPKLQHVLVFGNRLLSAAAVDDFVVSSQFVLETIDGQPVHERLTELRALPTSVQACVPLLKQFPGWFDLSLDVEEAAVVSGSSNNNNTESDDGTLPFTLELLPTKFTRRSRTATLVEQRIQSALQHATSPASSLNAGAAFSEPAMVVDKKAVATLSVACLRFDRAALHEFAKPPSAPSTCPFEFSKLRRLDLSGNNIRSAPFKFLQNQQQQQQQQQTTTNDSNNSSCCCCPNLEFLSLADNRITSLRGLDSFSSSIRTLDVQGNELASLLGVPASLLVLYAENNRLSTLADVMKVGPKHQQQSGNQQQQQQTATTPLSRLRELYLGSNLFHACRDIVFPLKEKGTGALFILDITRNPFRDGDADAMHFALCHLPKTKVFNGVPVEAAQLQAAREIHAGKLSEEILVSKVGPPAGWRNVAELAFANMALREIDLLASFSGLQHLVLEGNMVSDLSPLAKCVSLQSLDVSFNRALGGGNNPADVGGCLTGARGTLSSLALEGCNIVSVSALNLGRLPNLRFLNLKGNEIVDMSQGFEGLTKLRELVLDQNKIKTIDGLGRCAQLEKLSMDENLVKSMEGVRYLRALTFLGVAMNRIVDLNEFENIAMCGSVAPAGATNAENVQSARPVSATPTSQRGGGGGGSPFYSNPQQQQQQSAQDNQLCKVDNVNVQSNPCIRKLGNPAYRILCVRMIPSLRTVDGQYVSQDEFDRAFPAPIVPVDGQQQQMTQQQQFVQNLSGMPQPGGGGGGGGGGAIQPLTTFKMMEPVSSGFRSTVGGIVRDQQQQQQQAPPPPQQQQPRAPAAVGVSGNALNMYNYGTGRTPTSTTSTSGGGTPVGASRKQPPATTSSRPTFGPAANRVRR